MSIKKELKYQSIVVLATNFNPSIFSSYWLIKNGFLKEEEINAESIFSPNIAQIITKNFSIIITPPKLELIFNNNDFSFGEVINKVLIPIILSLKEVPYKGIGINFSWFVNNSELSIPEFSRKLFFNNSSPFYNEMDSSDSRFGAYLSKEFEKTRLKLDIKPIKISQLPQNKNLEFIQYSFNFHADFNTETAFENLVELIKNWKLYRAESDKIIKKSC